MALETGIRMLTSVVDDVRATAEAFSQDNGTQLASSIAYATMFARGFLAMGSPLVLKIVNTILSIAVITVVFASMYKVVPNVSIRWADVWAGGIATAILFVGGEVYYSALIVLVGAEYTKVRARSAGADFWV